ncbi:hypothetical protein BJ965_006993 [Streptomyces luteogriseus]|uniref:Uncharacterized protein n=1 Tax=Streptomyces luteogriseus TaxID=68233 RepID=A0A7W7DUB5_9ACTN|nr:hypothetical protein [Streptomyces luteogriseus]MBB4717111.1 hypothetical protein [Streptomyces luteogriseus]
MWLILCDPTDPVGNWARQGLRDRGLTPVELVTPDDLLYSTQLDHRVERSVAGFRVRLADGRTFADSDITGALNRVVRAPIAPLALASEADTLYAKSELSALMLSLLMCIAPVAVNQPSARGFCGAWRSAAEWTLLAARAGLPVRPRSLSSHAGSEPPGPAATHTLVVFRESVFGGEDVQDLIPACVQLANLAGTDLLEIGLYRDSRSVTFTRATPLPDLRLGGDPLLDHLHSHFYGLAVRAS